MDSLFRQALVIHLLLLAVFTHTDARRRRPFIPGKTEAQPTTAAESSQDTRVQAAGSNMADFERRMADVERSTSVMKQEMLEAKSENTRLKEELNSMGGMVRELDASTQRVEELQRMLTKFENFFGVLYTDLPDVFAREMTVNRRLSQLNEYLGNREAELVALRPNPPFVIADPEDNPVNENLMEAAVMDLTSENTKLRRRLDNMESQMVNIPSQGPGIVTGGEPDQETKERLTRLERLLALQLASVLDEEDTVTDQTEINGGKRIASGGSTNQGLALSESDTEILREELNSVRSISSTRKSVFSAGATRHMNGEARVHKPLLFDYVFSNKGGHFQEHNSTFICSITGFYFMTFTVRSYDNRYLGVNLLLNGDPVTAVSGELHPERNQMMTQSVVLHLTPGDKLWLTIAPANNYAVYSDRNKYCTFTGFLLFKGS